MAVMEISKDGTRHSYSTTTKLEEQQLFLAFKHKM